jgi:hypothetical protein
MNRKKASSNNVKKSAKVGTQVLEYFLKKGFFPVEKKELE